MARKRYLVIDDSGCEYVVYSTDAKQAAKDAFKKKKISSRGCSVEGHVDGDYHDYIGRCEWCEDPIEDINDYGFDLDDCFYTCGVCLAEYRAELLEDELEKSLVDF